MTERQRKVAVVGALPERTVGAGAVVVPADHPHGFVDSGAGRLR